MNTMQIMFLLFIFLIVSIIMFAILTQVTSSKIDKRLSLVELDSPLKNNGQDQLNTPKWVVKIVELAGPIANISLPKGGWEQSKLRISFMNAGYRNASAPVLFFTAKTILTFVLPGLFVLYAIMNHGLVKANTLLALMLFFATIGYFLPNVFLSRRIAYRKREIFESFPDALDLIIVCVEAGLGLDAALARVGEEMHMRSPILGAELHLTNLEIRAGNSREKALRNLALRTGVEDIDSLVAILVQSERFGTSVGDALRVHADSLRTKRRLRAEEAAAKIAVKLLFPLIFFIFPSMLVVLLGPAVISIHNILLPRLSGQ